MLTSRVLMSYNLFFLIFLLPIICSCKNIFVGKEEFPDIGKNIAGPTAVAVSKSGNYFYILNSDFDREHDSGSLLVIDANNPGQRKVQAVATPRIGRSLAVGGDYLLATFDREAEGDSAYVWLFSLADEKNPRLLETKAIDCFPVNGVIREGYPYFFISCRRDGRLYIGEIKGDQITLGPKLVRSYGITKRALYLDPKRELLFAFTTDMAEQSTSDAKLGDAKTYDHNSALVADKGANEVPDDYEDSKSATRNARNSRSVFQYAVYDIAAQRAEQAEVFPYKDIWETERPSADHELGWLYFTLLDADGTPDSDESISSLGVKNYRTNIFDAKPNPIDDDSFYISQRAMDNPQHANNVIKVSIVGNPRAILKGSGCPAEYVEVYHSTKPMCRPTTASTLKFERVYGFNGEIDELSFPGDFEVGVVNGEQMLVVNSFRQVRKKKNQHRFSITAKTLDSGFWRIDLASEDYDYSYYQLAMNDKGQVLVLSFYGNSAILYNIVPGISLKNIGAERID